MLKAVPKDTLRAPHRISQASLSILRPSQVVLKSQVSHHFSVKLQLSNKWKVTLFQQSGGPGDRTLQTSVNHHFPLILYRGACRKLTIMIVLYLQLLGPAPFSCHFLLMLIPVFIKPCKPPSSLPRMQFSKKPGLGSVNPKVIRKLIVGAGWGMRMTLSHCGLCDESTRFINSYMYYPHVHFHINRKCFPDVC